MIFDKDNLNHVKSQNKFSVPYNGEEPKIFLEILEQFKPFIHDIFLSLPDTEDFFSFYIKKFTNPLYFKKCKELLKMIQSDNIPIKTVVTLNGNYIKMPFEDKEKFVKNAVKQIKKYNIYGAVVSDYPMAELLHKELPDLVLNTSCNVPQYNLNHLHHWKEHCGVEIINPTRDSSKNIPLLKQFKNAGFKIKLLLNETCHIRCPNICSFCNVSGGVYYRCTNAKYKESPLQTCLVPPKWLDRLDDIVDIYKITGRFMSTNYIFTMLNNYINRTDFMIEEFGIPIPTSIIPDKQLECQHLNCESCKLCEKALSDYLSFFNMGRPEEQKIRFNN